MDSRFSAADAAPIFKKIHTSTHKTKLDPRFSGVLSDERFQLNPGEVDKYGRKTKNKDKKQAALKELQQFYEIEEDEEKESVANEEAASSSSNKQSKQQRNQGKGKQKGDKASAIESRLDYLNKLSRGEISESDSESFNSMGTSDSEENDNADEYEIELEEEEEEVMMAEGAETKRIAVQNCDWDKMKAVDIL